MGGRSGVVVIGDGDVWEMKGGNPATEINLQ